ncbi:unnamed protein product [Tilletia laevis]|uniref:Fungal lipase-type domain-containing protein n=1 Tax=Tilletia laevis TaxID=157183 RepID=A0A9N8QBJ8_9BASI|nr:unnamed protein product [Tilletia caries]CAD6921557.1 unnamed protein product [Tilletia laevis]CAD6961749.1 unnamed protein product [Tilletia laevis]
MGNVHKIPFVDSMGDPAFTSERPVSGSSKVGSLLSSPVSASTKTPVPFPEDLSTTITKKTVMYAGAAYCPSVSAGNWTCGRYCDANPDFVIGYSGGDGSVKQRFFIGWNPPTKEIVVGRQGSDLTQFVSWLYLVGFLQTKLDEEVAKTFSRLPNSVRAASPQSDKALASSGFQTAWKQTYAEVKAQVQAQLASHPDAVRIFVTGHSLGAAIAVLDAIALRNVAPTGVQVEVSVTGQPRVGNPVFAALLDQLVDTPSQNFVYNRITNHKDPIPHFFPSFSGYEHSSNEIWIPEAKSNSTSPALLCPGRENMNCANSQVSNLDLLEHPGKSFGEIPERRAQSGEAPGSIDGF